MALLFSGIVDTQGDRLDLETVGSFSFVQDTPYVIQVIGSSCILGGDSTSGGFIIDNSKPFQYTADGNGLYIKTNGKVSINIEG